MSARLANVGVDSVGSTPSTLAARLAAVDWDQVRENLDARGHAVIPKLLGPALCASVAGLDAEPTRFRSQVVMQRHGFGRGSYRYFAYPLPAIVETLRIEVYPELAPLANTWTDRLARSDTGTEAFPPTHAAFLARCHAAGQSRPTPLLLRYTEGDYNCLHQDLYGAQVFPMQLAVLLSAPGRDFSGGEFVLVEQRPRAQSRATVVPLAQGDGVVFAVNHRPVTGTRGPYRVALRHGVSEIRQGHRMTLGIIFHDAE